MWIDFEGIDGSGKTTVSTRAAEALRRRGVPVVHARENGRFASAIAGRVRELVRSPENLRLAPEAELLMNLAREAQLVSELVRPALRQGAWVITDRSTESHLALAGRIRGLPRAASEAAAGLAAQGLRPDRVFLIDADPDVARWRRRVRKIRDRAPADGGRKGLLGERLAWGMREAFRESAREARWTVIDNTWRTPEETVRAVLAALDGGDRPAPEPPEFEADPEDLLGSYFGFAGSLRDRSLAAMLVAGLDDPRADGIRRSAPPDEAAYALTGMAAPAAWALREEIKGAAPHYVARSLSGLGPAERAWILRRELEPAAPEGVLHSLRGEPGAEAHRLRRRHWASHREESLRSLRGLDDEAAWELRGRARREEAAAALAESLAGLDTPPAWEIRRALREDHPLAVLRGAQGLGHPEAWALRRELARTAPKVVLASIAGMDDPEADALREELRELAPEETAASLAGIDTPEAWARRGEMSAVAPVGTVQSVSRADRARGEALVGEIVRRFPRRLRVAREAVQFRMEASWMPSST